MQRQENERLSDIFFVPFAIRVIDLYGQRLVFVRFYEWKIYWT